MTDVSQHGHYRRLSEGWEHEQADYSAGITADSMFHLPCSDKEHGGSADLTGGGTTGLRLTGGFKRFSEEWTCRDCGKVQRFLVDEYVGRDQPIYEHTGFEAGAL